MFAQVPACAGDPILSLFQDYMKDERAEKVNLSIGLYYDAQGTIPVLKSVQRAQEISFEQRNKPDLYLPMEGLNAYRDEVQKLVFGAEHAAVKEPRIATIQTLGGSGALRIGADFLKRYFPESEVWISDPTWDNHQAIFEGGGFKVHKYPYFDKETLGVNFDAMIESLSQLPARSIVLLHPCCHNPTGADLTPAQFDQLITVLLDRELIPFMDMAYQGLGESLDADCYLIRKLAEKSGCALVSNSFSKIFSLYGERVGGLSIVTPDAETASRVLGQLKATVRRSYSSPSRYGAESVETVLNRPELNQLWRLEVDTMRTRIQEMRQLLADQLKEKLPEHAWQHYLTQRGMFSYTGFSVEQVLRLREEFGVYLVNSGRVCMAGINHQNIDRVAEAFLKVSL